MAITTLNCSMESLLFLLEKYVCFIELIKYVSQRFLDVKCRTAAAAAVCVCVCVYLFKLCKS